MSTHDLEQADLLEQYLTARKADPAAKPPPGLDSETVAAFEQLEATLVVPGPAPEFSRALRARLEREAVGLSRPARAPGAQARAPRFSLPRWSFVGVGAAVVLALAAFVLFAVRPTPVSAEQLIERARSAASDISSAGVRSFEMTQTSFDLIADNPGVMPTRSTRGETKIAYAGPGRWRIETHYQTTDQQAVETLTISDGSTQWDYRPGDSTVTISAADSRNFPSPSVLSLETLQEDMSNCYDPKVAGEETIAGRAAYKVELGPAKCRSASMPMLNGPHTIWLDKATFFVLKSEIRAVDRDLVTSSLAVTSIRYNAELPDSLFTFTPPAGVRTNDQRPKPAPSASEFTTQLAALASNAPFPVFAPATVPAGLVPLAPVMNEVENQLELTYVPPAEVGGPLPVNSKGLTIYERLADYELVRAWTDGAAPLELEGAQAWVRRGDYDPASGTGSNSAVLVLRDGTLTSVSSFAVSADDLIALARTLQPVPGGHAALPNPVAPTLAEIRANSKFPFRVPTYLPEGLSGQPPTSHELRYQRADGSPGLLVMNAAPGEGGMETEPRFLGESVTLPKGRVVHVLGFNPEIIIIWWDEGGGYTSLEGHNIPREEMLKIAEGMSDTAELPATP